MSWNEERKKELEGSERYYDKALKDAEDRLARGESQYPDGSNVSFFVSIFRWLLGITRDDLDDWRKLK